MSNDTVIATIAQALRAAGYDVDYDDDEPVPYLDVREPDGPHRTISLEGNGGNVCLVYECEGEPPRRYLLCDPDSLRQFQEELCRRFPDFDAGLEN